MNSFKIVIICFILIFSFENSTFAQNGPNPEFEKTPPPVEFNQEEIEKVKTLIESHFQTRISEAEFSMYGKASEENLALFKSINETKKENPFFSQPHITFIIDSMEERLGMKRPQSKLEKMSSPKVNPQIENISKLPKGKRDH